MHIGIIGTRGIPNNYGGFEQCAEFLAGGLVKENFEVSVYNSHNHPYQKKTWNGVHIIHCYDPEDRLGTAGQFVYDLNCILDSRSRNFDIILQLGYTSSTIWGQLFPRKKSIITTNMDGLEWKRSKYSKVVQRFLQYAEKLGVKYSDFLIADSIGIQKYLQEKYNVESTFIAYGANLFEIPEPKVLEQYHVKPLEYSLLIARLEPENSIEVILEGVCAASTTHSFLVIGNHNTKYGVYLKEKFSGHSQIRFIGGVYNLDYLNNLRYYSNLYFHGHTVGGTNPSLLEAMASNALICAQDNIFNRSILGEDAYYFIGNDAITSLICKADLHFKEASVNQSKLRNNALKIQETYAWPIIVSQYIAHFRSIKPNITPEKGYFATSVF